VKKFQPDFDFKIFIAVTIAIGIRPQIDRDPVFYFSIGLQKKLAIAIAMENPVTARPGQARIGLSPGFILVSGCSRLRLCHSSGAVITGITRRMV
jgi:hypothetical protein